jgi:hypothetical protein
MTNFPPPTRYYILMWAFIVLFGLGLTALLIDNERRPNTAITLGMAMFTWGAILAFRGRISEAKWLIGALLVLQLISLSVRLFISDDILSLSDPSMSRQVGIVSSLAATLTLLSLFYYARSLERSAIRVTTQNIKEPTKAGRGKSYLEMYRERNLARVQTSQVGASTEYGTYINKNETNITDGAHFSEIDRELSLQDETSAWRTATDYFPELEQLYSQLKRFDPVRAEQYKSNRLALKDFSDAQTAYWRLLNDIAENTCGVHNTESRTFLLSAINNGDYQTARQFIALAKTLGAANMNADVLAKFKSSKARPASDDPATLTKSKRPQSRDLEFDDG